MDVGIPRPAPSVTAADGRLERLFVDLRPNLQTLTARLVGDHAEAEDVVQEAFLRLVRDPVVARPDAEIRAWLTRVCLNLGSNRLRSRRRAVARLERVGRLEASRGDDDPPAAGVLRDEERAAVHAALAGLPARQRDCLLLRHSGYSYAEIAAALGVATGSVGVLLARAERRFRRRYQR